jgi:hypothetical protein
MRVASARSRGRSRGDPGAEEDHEIDDSRPGVPVSSQDVVCSCPTCQRQVEEDLATIIVVIIVIVAIGSSGLVWFW